MTRFKTCAAIILLSLFQSCTSKNTSTKVNEEIANKRDSIGIISKENSRNKNYKSISLNGWQKISLDNYYFMIPPNYTYNYDRYGKSDSSSGTITNNNHTIRIWKGYTELDTFENGRNVIRQYVANGLIFKIHIVTTRENSSLLSFVCWDDRKQDGLLKNHYDGIQMSSEKWDKDYIDTIMAIYNSVGKSE